MASFPRQISSLLLFCAGFVLASVIHLNMPVPPKVLRTQDPCEMEERVPDNCIPVNNTSLRTCLTKLETLRSTVDRSVHDCHREFAGTWRKFAAVQNESLLREDKLMTDMHRYRRTCQCPSSPPDWYKAANERRLKESKRWKQEMDVKREPFALCKAFSPFSYVGSGINVEPFDTVPIVGLNLSPAVEEIFRQSDMSEPVTISFVSVKKYGVFKLSNPYANAVSVEGKGTSSLLVRVKKDVSEINRFFRLVIYTATAYRIDAFDKIQVSALNFTIDIFIHIRRQPLPDLIDPGPSGSVIQKVTVITKTFERPDVAKRFVDSVHRFYPNMTIIIADDSRDLIPILNKHVKYFTMPFREGSYPGINLALSQVATKFTFFSDDDYIFTNETRLELMIEKLENLNANIDIVVPRVIGLPELGEYWNIKYNESGMCHVSLRDIPLELLLAPGYPQCKYADFFENVLLAKTVVYRKIGYYPPVIPCTHAEFWTNAVGKASIARCDDVTILHDHGRNPVYDKFRNEVGNIEKKQDPAPMFENNFCYSKHYNFFQRKRTV